MQICNWKFSFCNFQYLAPCPATGKRAPGISGMKPAQRKKVVNPELLAAQRKPSGLSRLNRTARAVPLSRSAISIAQSGRGPLATARSQQSELFTQPEIFNRPVPAGRWPKVGGMPHPSVHPHTFDASALERFTVLACFLRWYAVCRLTDCCDRSNRALQGACLSLE